MVTFHGPAIMAGFSQMESLDEDFDRHVRDILFHPRERYEFRQYTTYHEGYPDWGVSENIGMVNRAVAPEGWSWLQ